MRVLDSFSDEHYKIKANLTFFFLTSLSTREGEIIKTHAELKLINNGQQIIAWPEIVCHVIDESSPMRDFKSAKDLNAAHFELYVSIVGVSPATAQVTETRTSYMPQEVHWGQRFVNIITYDANSRRYVYDYSNFNTTISVSSLENDSLPST